MGSYLVCVTVYSQFGPTIELEALHPQCANMGPPSRPEQTQPLSGDEGAGAPLPGEAGAGAPPPPASGVDAIELPVAVAQMPAPKRKVHYDFHMGDFIIERFKQYIAPYRASGGELMGLILGKATTLNTQPILTAWGLFFPPQQFADTDDLLTPEERWGGARG